MKPYIAWAVLGAIALDAAAQQSSLPHPADPSAQVPQARYRSVFESYVPYREQALAPWREVNDEVARIGGHAGIFRGGQGHPTAAKPAAGETGDAARKEPVRQQPEQGMPKTLPGGGHGH